MILSFNLFRSREGSERDLLFLYYWLGNCQLITVWDVARVCKELANTEVFFQSAGGRVDRISGTASYVAPLFFEATWLRGIRSRVCSCVHIRSSEWFFWSSLTINCSDRHRIWPSDNRQSEIIVLTAALHKVGVIIVHVSVRMCGG